ncbi:Diamine acetyltransferase 2 [Chamberlinius hualienensis]
MLLKKMSLVESILIRKGTKDDCTAIFQLYQKLSESEKLVPDEIIDEKVFTREGFGENPCFEVLVVELKDNSDNVIEIIGFALYFYHYAMVSGRTIFVECLYVKPNYQNRGFGKRLWKEVIKVGLETGCKRCMFMAFGWNQKALQFYTKCGAADWTIEKDEHCLHMPKDAMIKFANS